MMVIMMRMTSALDPLAVVLVISILNSLISCKTLTSVVFGGRMVIPTEINCQNLLVVGLETRLAGLVVAAVLLTKITNPGALTLKKILMVNNLDQAMKVL